METIDVHTTKTAKLLKMADFNKNRIQILELAKKMWKPHWSKLSKVQKNMVLKTYIEKTNTANCSHSLSDVCHVCGSERTYCTMDSDKSTL